MKRRLNAIQKFYDDLYAVLTESNIFALLFNHNMYLESKKNTQTTHHDHPGLEYDTPPNTTLNPNNGQLRITKSFAIKLYASLEHQQIYGTFLMGGKKNLSKKLFSQKKCHSFVDPP